MSFGASIGSSAASGLLGGFFGGFNSFLRQGAFGQAFGGSSSPWITSALGGGGLVGLEHVLGGALKRDDKYQDQRSFNLARRLADLQYQYQQRSLLESPTNYRLGITAAGYNPILAFNHGQMSSPMPSVPSPNPASSAETKIASLNSLAALEQAQASNRAAAAAERNAATNEWVVYDAQSLGTAGFEVLGYGASGQARTIQSIRLNKVTGEVYDALSGQKIRVMNVILPNGKKDATTAIDAKEYYKRPKTPSERNLIDSLSRIHL